MVECRFCRRELPGPVPGFGSPRTICVPCEDAIVARADVARARPDFRHVVLEACVVCLGHMTGRSNQALICSRRCASTLRRARLRDRALADSGAGAHDGVSPLSTVPCRLCGFDSPGRFSSTGAPASKICTPCERAIVERAAAARAHPNYGLVALEACAVCLGVIGPQKRGVTCSNRCASTLALVTTRDRLRGSHDRDAGGDAAAAAALFGDVASTSDNLGVEEGADAGISGIDDALDASTRCSRWSPPVSLLTFSVSFPVSMSCWHCLSRALGTSLLASPRALRRLRCLSLPRLFVAALRPGLATPNFTPPSKLSSLRTMHSLLPARLLILRATA